MPKIPTIQADSVIRTGRLSPQAAAAPSLALAQAGEQLQQTGDYAYKMSQFVERKEQEAARDVLLSEARIGLRKDADLFAEGFAKRTDFENFDKDSERQLEEIQSRYQPKFQDDPIGLQQFNELWSVTSTELGKVARARRNTVKTDRGKAALDEILRQKVEEYSVEDDPQKRDLIREDMRIDIANKRAHLIIDAEQEQAYIAKYIDQAEFNRAEKMVDSAPDDFLQIAKQGGFDLPRAKLNDLEKAARIRSEQLANDKRIQAERAETKAEKARKLRMEANDLDMRRAFYTGTLTESSLNDLNRKRMISEGTYNSLMKDLRKGETAENNPLVVGEINELITRRQFTDAREQLDLAVSQNQIKAEKYIQIRDEMNEKGFQDGMTYINRAIQPGMLDFEPSLKFKWANAGSDYLDRLSAGEDYLMAAKEMVDLYKADVVRMVQDYRNPRKLKGQKNDPSAINQAEIDTLLSYRTGEFNETEFRNEMKLIHDIKQALETMTQIQNAQENQKGISQENIKLRKLGK